jgi:hypothetical protein
MNHLIKAKLLEFEKSKMEPAQKKKKKKTTIIKIVLL